MAELDNGVPASVREATAVLNDCDTVIVQHEYGLYGGTDGDEMLDILRPLSVPCIVVAHTVLLDPTSHQKQVLEAICEIGQRRGGHGRDGPANVCAAASTSTPPK